MGRVRKSVLIIFLASLGASIVATITGYTNLSGWFGGPAALLAGWTVAGHLITIDDDYPGGWSNMEESRSIWAESLAWLAAEAAIFVLVTFIVFVLPTWRENFGVGV